MSGGRVHPCQLRQRPTTSTRGTDSVSLVRFNIQNHPQQVAKRGAKDSVDERITPPAIFEPLRERFGFTIDVAASQSNAKCGTYFDRETDGLAQSWAAHAVWCNPPYSDIAPWVAKAWDEFEATRTIVMLLPANRTEQRWWQRMVEPYRDNGKGLTTEFLPGRINFGVPGNEEGKWHSSAPFGCVLVIWRRS